MDFTSILKSFSPFSFDNDSNNLIESLHLLPFENLTEEIRQNKKLVILIVEKRLLEEIPESTHSAADLIKRIYTLKSDLLSEGYDVRCISAEVYCGPIHQDGKILLAIRNFLKKVKEIYENLDGIILIGSFPDAMIVRTWLRPETVAFSIPDENASFPDGTLAYHVGSTIQAHRSDIVLADLGGNWDNIYHLSGAVPDGIFKPDTERKASSQWTRVTSKRGHFKYDNVNYSDYFWIQDDEWRIESQGQDSITLLMNSNQIDSTRTAFNQLNPELSCVDRLSPNAIAQPDIFISRINAKNIAVNPDPCLLDQHGKPKQTPYNPGISTDIFKWVYNPDLERKLLIDYFDRNHLFRKGHFSNHTVSISKIEYDRGFGSVNDGLDGINAFSNEITNASLLEFVKWLKTPVSIRGINAHTAGRAACMTVFSNDNQYYQMEIQSGGTPWRWIHQNGEYVPSFEGQYTLDMNLCRTIWENNILKNNVPSFYLHTGNDVNTPDKADTVPYNHEAYALCQSSESILFYLNGLTVLAKSKASNDGPKGFGIGLGVNDDAHFGNGWKEYYRFESMNTTIAKKPTERKRCYFWNLLGDWTLKKYYTQMSKIDNKQARVSSGFFKQSNFGKNKRNFELVCPSEKEGLVHFYRDNDDAVLNWCGPTIISDSKFDTCSMIQSNFGDIGNFEVVARSGSKLHYFWREDSWPYEWHTQEILQFSLYEFCGNPAFIQTNLGGLPGNFELVIPVQRGGLAHMSRANNIEGVPWAQPIFFGDQKEEISGLAMIQSTFGLLGNLEVVAIEKKQGRLVQYWREDQPPYKWYGPIYFGGPGFTGTPALIQSKEKDEIGNFELIVPVKGGGMAHYCRKNNQQGCPWVGPVYFGDAEVSAVSILESSFSQNGRFEIVAIESGKPVLYWRDTEESSNWYGPEEIAVNKGNSKKTVKVSNSLISEAIIA